MRKYTPLFFGVLFGSVFIAADYYLSVEQPEIRPQLCDWECSGGECAPEQCHELTAEDLSTHKEESRPPMPERKSKLLKHI